ncbi:MAG: cyclic nucleotide-binding domain-containing protein [Sphingomonadaceae bacterium]
MQAILADLTNPENAFGHLSYIFLIASMMMTSLRKLRILALCSGLAAMAHFLLRTQDNVSLAWEAIFTLTNATQLAILIYRSRKLDLREKERALVEDTLGFDDALDWRRLLALVDWRDVDVGEVLMEQGTQSPPLIYIASGAAMIEDQGKMVGVCGPGDFVGEMSLVSGNPASATVRATNRLHIAVFDPVKLDQTLSRSQDMRSALMAAFNRGLAAKVLRMNETRAS